MSGLHSICKQETNEEEREARTTNTQTDIYGIIYTTEAHGFPIPKNKSDLTFQNKGGNVRKLSKKEIFFLRHYGEKRKKNFLLTFLIDL